MSETAQQTPVMPADLPPDSWIPFDSFAFLLPGMSKLTWENGSKAGRLPAGRRFSRKSPLVHRAGDIAEFFRSAAAEVNGKRTGAPLEAGSTTIAVIDEALLPTTPEVLKRLMTGSAEVGQ